MKQSFYKITSNRSLLPLRSFGGFLLWLLPLWLSAQTSTQNYIVTTVPFQKATDPTTLIDANSNTTIQYFDGLGRPSQTVQRAITPTSADLVSGIEYDPFGRDYRHWLPGAAAGNNGAYVSDFSTPAVSTNGGDSKPYATTEYDGSPLNRVTGQYGTGVDWYNNTKKKTIDYTTNGSDVKHYYVDGTQLKCDGPYNAATLYGQKTTDEDGKTVEEFSDKQGRKILSRVAGDHDTYYVYDDLDNLRYVLPPMAADALGTNATGFGEAMGSTLYNYAYIYHYDGRKRCTDKKLPGSEPILMVYDLADRLVASQDGVQKLNSRWTVNKYDKFNRVVYTYIATKTPEEIASALGSNPINETLGTDNLTGGYTLTGSIPVTAMLTVNYYDSYSFIPFGNNLNYDSSQEQNGYTAYYSNAKGLLTGTRVYHLDNPSLFETTTLYYDKYGRVVQSRSTNHLLGYDIVYNELKFTGAPARTLKTHNIAGQASVVELYTYDYNKAQQPTITTYSLNGGGAVTLASNTYDDLGRLTTKKRHSNADTETFAYNIRNWTTNITSGGFTENLYYNANPLNSNATYNGNISYSTWTYSGAAKGYLYEYDGLNRLLSSSFKQGSSGLGDDSFNETFTYDKMGNILTLKRKKNYTQIDDLVFHYGNNEKSNQLQYVDDGGATQNQYLIKEYQNKSSAQAEFEYDANGNMKKDLDRDIATIRYNVLNLPDVVQFKNGNQIKNIYNAGGQKLGTEYFTWLPGANAPVVNIGDVLNISYSQGAIDQNGTVYIGNLEYNTKNGNSSLTAISRIHNMEGYVENISNPNYYYYRKDHLGNNREVWLANTNTTKQWTQYYPSGLPWVTTSNDNLSTQPYKYNGKEFVEMHGYDTYDYGARGYYAAIGGWPTVDPLCEKYYSISPYVYCLGNPVKYIDPNGMWTETGSGYNTDDPEEISKFLNNQKQKSEENNSLQKQKQETVDNLKAFENSCTGLYNQVQKLAAAVFDIFAQKEETTTPSGEKTINYKARNFTPDYMSVDLSGNAYIPLLPALGGGFDLSLGYVRNDGLFLLGGTKTGVGFDFSISTGFSLGGYTGNFKPSAMSLTGLGAYQNLGVGIYSIGSSQNLTFRNGSPSIGSQWIINNISVGVGLTPVSGSFGISNTFQPYYLFKK